ncbi:MAG: hypothetical protein PARBA_03631 [Parabacteroides sp.]
MKRHKYLNIMRANYLFPEIFRKIGWCLLVPFLALGLFCLFWDGGDVCQIKVLALYTSEPFSSGFFRWVKTGILDELSVIGLTFSLLFISFSREKDEDECIERIRMQSLVWSILGSSLLLILATLFIYGFAFMTFAFINMFTVLVLFIGKYNWELYKFRRVNNE